MTLQQWDKEIAPHFHRILNNAETCGRYAQYVKASVAALPQRPEWKTMARDELDAIGAQLLAALKQIHDAREAYDAKQVIEESAA